MFILRHFKKKNHATRIYVFFSPFHNPIHENDLILVSRENKILTRENKNITPLKINNKNINGSPLCSCLSIYHGLCFIHKVKKRRNHTNRIWQPKSNMANVCLIFYLLKDTFQLHTVSATVGISLNYVIISKA